jgi:formylmethanofuran dehydrogenase subunit C
LTFDGIGAQIFNQGSSAIGSDIIISGTSSTTLATNALNIGANDLTVNGSIDIAALAVTATGTFSNNGTVYLNGGNTITLTQDTNSGTWTYKGNSNGSVNTFTIKEFGVTDYYNLVIDTVDVSDILNLGAAASIAGTLDVSNGTYDANGFATTITGLFELSGNGFYAASTATQTFNSGISVIGGTFSGSSGTVDVNGDIDISGAIFFAPSGTMTISGDFNKLSGSFLNNSGTVIFDPSLDHAIIGTITWNNLTVTEASDNGANSTLTIEAGNKSAYCRYSHT